MGGKGAEHPPHHAPVDCADDRVVQGGVSEGAVLGHDAQSPLMLLCVGREAVGRECVGHRVKRGSERTLSIAIGSQVGRHDPAVLEAHLLGQGLGLVPAEAGAGPCPAA